jgi:hypothetical protein
MRPQADGHHWAPQAEFPARQYDNALLPLYIEFVDTIWIPEHSERYFRTRDPLALPHLPKLLPMAHKAKPALPDSSGRLPKRFSRRLAKLERPPGVAIPASAPISELHAQI